jgi:hypothetical protein
MMPPYSCEVPGMKPGTSTKVMTGILKASQKRTKRAALIELFMSKQPANNQRLIGHNAHCLTGHAGKTNEHVFGIVGLKLKEVTVVNGLQN